MITDQVSKAVLGTAMSAVTGFAILLFNDNRAQDREIADLKADQAVATERYQNIRDDIKDVKETQIRVEVKVEEALRNFAGNR